MTLRRSINLIVGALTLLFIAVVLTLQLRSLHDAVREEVFAANRVAMQLLNRTAWRYASQGTPAMLAFLQGVGRVRSTDIRFFDLGGAELYHSPASPYKAGRDAPAWFDRMMAPPPVVQSIALPDGRLEVRADASRATLDAWDDTLRLLLAATSVLVVVNALMYWLVGRAVRPFGEIVHALDTLQAGRFDVALPPLAGTEAAAIGAAFNRMVGVLQQNIDNERRAARAERELLDRRELGRWIDHHIEQERSLIARELHDELGQSVTAMRSMALSIAQRVHKFDAQAEAAARLIADEASHLYDAMHGIIPRLTPLVLDNFGLAEALNDLVERTRRSQPELRIELRTGLADTPLGADAALALYRAAQEGVTNALRHGHASQLQLALVSDARSVTLTLTDDGRGLPADWQQRRGHHGLAWLAERATGLGGSFDVGPATPHGVTLRVEIPLPAARDAAQAMALRESP